MWCISAATLASPTASLIAGRAVPGASAYAATKAALSSMLDGYRVEGKLYGLQITIVEPGFVRTPIHGKKPVSRPFMVDVDQAAQIIVEGVAEGKALIRFPWQMAAAQQLLRHLPIALFDSFGRKMVRKPRKHAD